MEKKSKIIYVDMDDVTADFYKAAANPIDGITQEEKMYDPFFFLRLDPVPGAKSAIYQLERMGFQVWLLSQPFTLLPESYMEKAQWTQLHFPQLVNRLILTQDKGLNLGHYLIDDNKLKWKDKFEKNGGTFIHFQYGGYNRTDMRNPELIWHEIIEFFKKENPYID